MTPHVPSMRKYQFSTRKKQYLLSRSSARIANRLCSFQRTTVNHNVQMPGRVQ